MKTSLARHIRASGLAVGVIGATLWGGLLASGQGAPQKPVGIALPISGIAPKGDIGFLIQHSGTDGAAFAGVSDGGVGVYGQGGNGVLGRAFGKGNSAVIGQFLPASSGGIQAQAIDFGGELILTKGRLGSATSGVEGFTSVPSAFAVVGKFGKTTEGILGTKEHGAVARQGKATEVLLAGALNAVVGKSTEAGGKGIAGSAEGQDAVAVYGQSAAGLAGFFRGKVTVQGILMAQQIFAPKGLVGSGAKFFKIDHPLEPAEKYLWHASVESDARKNMYDGVAVLDAKGAGWVQLPDWFQALNKEFRYQLTCIGGYAQVFIAQEIRNNRFQIAGGKPGLKVSWQVTGVRQDAYANANPMRVEEPKTAADRGRYLNPVELGFPESLRIGSTAVASIRP